MALILVPEARLSGYFYEQKQHATAMVGLDPTIHAVPTHGKEPVVRSAPAAAPGRTPWILVSSTSMTRYLPVEQPDSRAPEAAVDHDDIWYHTARRSSSTDKADRLVDAITERFYLLSTHPRLGRKRDDLRPGLRSFAVDEYVIIYRITEAGDVLILHVPHGRRDLPEIIGA